MWYLQQCRHQSNVNDVNLRAVEFEHENIVWRSICSHVLCRRVALNDSAKFIRKHIWQWPSLASSRLWNLTKKETPATDFSQQFPFSAVSFGWIIPTVTFHNNSRRLLLLPLLSFSNSTANTEYNVVYEQCFYHLDTSQNVSFEN